MRILIASPWIPYPLTSGMAIRTVEIARRLAREHEVTFALATRWKDDPAHCEALRKEGFGVIAMPGDRAVTAVAESLYAIANGQPLVNAFRGSRALGKELVRD